MWRAGNCSITESLPELIQQVRQDLAWARGEVLMASKLETIEISVLAADLLNQAIGSLHLVFPQSLWEQLFSQICRNNQ